MTGSPEARPESAQEDGAFECPNCGSSSIVRDFGNGKVVCSTCGQVIKEKSFDRGPEWRSFDQEDEEKKSRAGPPRTETRHDRGLSTEIDYRNRDARGKSLSPEKRARMSRLRRWHKRGKIEDAQDRNLSFALRELDRLSSQLGLPDSVQEGASRIYRRAVERGMIRGRSIESVAAAAAYIECRRENVPRTLAEIAEVSPADVEEIDRNQRYIEKELDIKSGVSDPATFISRFASRLDLSGEVRGKAIELIGEAREKGLASGRSPSAVAAGALYIACLMTDERRAQHEIAKAADVTEVTIRNRYRELAGELEIPIGEKKKELSVLGRKTAEREEKEPGAEEIEAKNVRYENVVASVTFEDTELDLEELADKLGSNADYDPDEFPGVSYFQEDSKASFLIFESGKVNCVGTASVEEAKKAPKLLAEELAERGFEVDPDPKVEIQNIVVRADFGATIDLRKLHNSSCETSYDPGSFPGLQLVLDEPDVDFLLFANGEGVLHADREEDIDPAFEEVSKILREFAAKASYADEEREAIGWLEKKPRHVNLLNSLQEGATTPTELAKRLDVKRETAEKYARGCSREGLVELQEYGRGYRIKITEKGKKTLDALSEEV